MSFPSACCNTPPVKAQYTQTGEMGKLGDVACYYVGDKASKRGIIVNYDIFGYHPNVIQLCDILAGAGYQVILPDFLKGDPLTEADLGKAGVFAKFVETRGSWATNKPTYLAARDHLLSNGATSISAVGFCWGSKMVISALAELEGLAGGAVVHPALLVDEDFDKVKAPLLALPSKDEPDFTSAFAKTKAKAFGARCQMVRFDDMHHGFCGARGDWSVPEQAKRANEAIQLLIEFVNNVSTAA
ncbi:alpha/beta-hydrolase [Martensiomyces pterosporus]|nr:alpha/beta-hydrolase [Martensiomyces pterosporus]